MAVLVSFKKGQQQICSLTHDLNLCTNSSLFFLFFFSDAWGAEDDLFKALNVPNPASSSRPAGSSARPLSSNPGRSTPTASMASTTPSATPGTTSPVGSGFVRKEEKVAEMARKREERRLRMAEAKEKKTQSGSSLGAKKI